MNSKLSLIKLPNQRIKLSIDLIIKNKNLKSFSRFNYNKKLIFFYSLNILNSQIILKIVFKNQNVSFFEKVVAGSFAFDLAQKFQVSDIFINSSEKDLTENFIFGFMRKDFIYSPHKKNAANSLFKTNYKMHSKNISMINAVNFLKELVSEPSNIIFPESFVSRTKSNIKNSKVNIRVLNENQIKKIGLNCLLAVSQGSSKKPRVMEFSKKGFKKNIDVLFVGKGVCFDSGGISLKPSAGMEEMKWDMGGAAVTTAIIKYLSEIKTNFSYAGIIGLVENMPSGTAYKPGDIIRSYKGINVEVLNTDAEGRLVLADVITYGCEIYKPKIVIDFATLTGAIMVALGQHYAGMFSNDDGLSESLYKSGIDTNEKVWRMPLHDDFDKELNSPFVDLKNIGPGRYGGSVTAAQFLQRFVPPKTKWAHLDIAGTTWKNSGDILNSKGATGFGLTLIADFIDRYFKN